MSHGDAGREAVAGVKLLSTISSILLADPLPMRRFQLNLETSPVQVVWQLPPQRHVRHAPGYPDEPNVWSI